MKLGAIDQFEADNFTKSGEDSPIGLLSTDRFGQARHIEVVLGRRGWVLRLGSSCSELLTLRGLGGERADLLGEGPLDGLLAARLHLKHHAANCDSIESASILGVHVAIESDFSSSLDRGPTGTFLKSLSRNDHTADDGCLSED